MITVSEARGLFTKQLIDVYQERIRPKAFFRGFFPDKVVPTKHVSIEVERGYELVAVDVVRGTEGNRNTFSKSTEKIFEPPYWREFFDATQLDLYDRVLGSQTDANGLLFAQLMNEVSDRLGMLQDKVERAKELQCAQVLLSGVVNIEQADANIDFKRKAASLVDDGAGQYFANNINPFDKFNAGCKFLRTIGKATDSIFDAILGETAMADLLANTIFLARQNLFNMALDQVTGPARQGVGSNLNGIITAGAYKVRLWTYPEFYEKPKGTFNQFMDPKKVILLPANPRFHFAHAAVPQLISRPGEMPNQGIFTIGEFIDERRTAHIFDIQSAGVPVPVAVDQIYTFKAVA